MCYSSFWRNFVRWIEILPSIESQYCNTVVIFLCVLCFRHETASGFYQVSAYFLSKIFCALIPAQLIPLIVFSVIIYFMIGKKPHQIFKIILILIILICSYFQFSTMHFHQESSTQSIDIIEVAKHNSMKCLLRYVDVHDVVALQDEMQPLIR